MFALDPEIYGVTEKLNLISILKREWGSELMLGIAGLLPWMIRERFFFGMPTEKGSLEIPHGKDWVPSKGWVYYRR